MQQYMLNKLAESWNVVVFSDGSTDVVKYYDATGCSINFSDQGKYRRRFLMWPLANKQYEIVGDCPAELDGQVRKVADQCQSSAKEEIARCMLSNMKSVTGIYYNIYVQENLPTSSSALEWSAFNNCGIKLMGYGTWKKNYAVWQGESK